MRLNFLILLLTSFISNSLFGQEIQTGIVSKLERREYVSKILGFQNDSLYILKRKRSTFSNNTFNLQIFNHKLNPTGSLNIETPNSSNENTAKDVFFFNNEVYTYYHSHNKITKTIGAKIINNNSQKKSHLSELTYTKSGNKPKFKLQVDSSHILLVSLPPINKNLNQTFHVNYLDTNLNSVIDEKIELPYPSQNFTLEKIKAQNENVYFLANNTSEKDFQNPQKFYLIRYNHQQKKLKEFELALKGKWITSATFELGKNNDLYIGGFYSNDRSFSVAGTFLLKIDLSTNLIIQKSLKPFSDDFLSQFLPPRKVRKGGELQSFYFDHFLINSSGEATFVAEQYYKSVSSYTDISSGLINYTTTYFYNDIIVVHANTNGEIEWNVKIPKKQYSTNDNGIFLSYALGYKNNTLSIIFNDHPKNLQAKDRDYQLRYMNNVYRAQPIHVTINNSGLAKYKKLNIKDGSLILRPRKAFVSGNKQQLIMLSEKGKNISISRINL